MARAAVKAKQQARAKAHPARSSRGGRRKRGAGGGNPNQDLFFMKLRRHAKWAYVLLAVLFAATFAAVGVGSGSSGLDQLFSGIFGGNGGGTSISKAQAEIAKHPAKGYLDLSHAYEAKGQTLNAISALESLTALKKKDASAFTELGQLQMNAGEKYYKHYTAAQSAVALSNPSQAFQPAGTLGTAIGTSPIEQLQSTQANDRASTFSQQASTEFGSALQSYESAAKLHPKDSLAQYYVAQAADASGQYTVEASALKRYLKLDPTAPNRSQIKAVIKQLEPAKKKK